MGTANLDRRFCCPKLREPVLARAPGMYRSHPHREEPSVCLLHTVDFDPGRSFVIEVRAAVTAYRPEGSQQEPPRRGETQGVRPPSGVNTSGHPKSAPASPLRSLIVSHGLNKKADGTPGRQDTGEPKYQPARITRGSQGRPHYHAPWDPHRASMAYLSTHSQKPPTSLLLWCNRESIRSRPPLQAGG